MRIVPLLTAALLTLTAVPAAAQAAPHHGHDSIRYASVKGCPDKDGALRPCGQWRLVMHDGGRRTLPDAQVVALDAKGRSSLTSPAPIAVSGDGQRVAYFTRAGRLAVRTLDGGVRLLPKDALPRVAQYEVTLRLSDDGARLAVAIQSDKPARTRIFDTTTGALRGTVPADETVVGLSGDGDEVLSTIESDDSVIDLVSRDDTGEQLARATPPQVVAANGPQALAADAHTVAVVVRGSRTELLTYDLATDEVTGRKKIKLPAGELSMIDWTGDTQVTLHLVSGSSRMTIVQIDTETGAVRIRDRYTLLKDTFVFAACGG
ncbi:hypothetical protein ACFFV7_19230 [Nonomuraea spiralis]|uniref:WD40 repeat domain-containing protein n=1 Tax=Nonomuraea spiralis TaxID=46182 RepID=A0ABV5IFM2_9ACTN|nr:hypothetical protein [Nonomuraea spiralis]